LGRRERREMFRIEKEKMKEERRIVAPRNRRICSLDEVQEVPDIMDVRLSDKSELEKILLIHHKVIIRIFLFC
jgi:hypothetical protein